MSFEHYPFDPCDPSIARDLLDEPGVMRGIMKTWVRDGLPAGVPMFVTETNFSASAGEPMLALSGGLWLADFEGSFLAAGGNGTYLYQYEPEPIVTGDCNSWGAWGMFDSDYRHEIRQPTSQYFVAQMISQAWAQPVDAEQTMFPADSDLTTHGKEIVTAYALDRPDGRWALLLVNNDPVDAYSVSVRFRNGSTGKVMYFSGTVSTDQFGPAQYVWHRNGFDGYADPDGPAVDGSAPGGRYATYALPADSVTVLRGTIAQSR
jgi:hypothetical protein